MGEAFTHNAVSFAAVGSAVIVIGAGTVASIFFEAAYDSNFLWIQDGLDWTGNKIDDAWENAKIIAKDAAENVGDAWEGTKDIANNVGEAVSDGLNAINPMNWAW